MADALADGLQRCLVLHQGGDLDSAGECYRRLLDQFPAEADLLHLFGLLRAQQGFLDEGKTHLCTAIASAPDVPLYHFNLASVCLEGGDNEEAITEFNRCRELSPVYAGVSLGIGRAQAALGHYALAVEFLEEAAFEQPDDPTALLLLGDLHLRHKFLDQAITTLEKARQQAGDVPEILTLLAQAHEDNGGLDQAIALYGAIATMGYDRTAANHVLRLEMLSRDRLEARNFTNELASLTATIGQGRWPTKAKLLTVLGRTDITQRIEANAQLARACLERPERSWHEQARVFAERAWMFSGFTDQMLPLQIQAMTALSDFQAVRTAYKRAGIEAAKRGSIGGALRHFNAWQNAYISLQQVDRYEFDFDILDWVDRLADPYRLDREPQVPQDKGGRLRLAFLVRGLTEISSVLVLLAKQYAKHHDGGAFEIDIFCVETRTEVQRSAQGADHVRELKEYGCQVTFAPALSRWEDRLLALAKAIHNRSADLLVTSAVLATLDHYFVMALRPAPKSVGFVHGPMPQFAPPSLDWGITATRHTQMDAPCNCTLVPVEIDPPQPTTLSRQTRAEFDIPIHGFILGSAGRPQKYQDPGVWQAIGDILAKHDTVYFLALGVTKAQVSHLIGALSVEVQQRLRFSGWRPDYLQLLAVLDVLIDTFPSGGGVVLLDAMALGVPVVSFENNYSHAFDQTDWSLGEEFIPVPELVLPRGDFGALRGLIGELIDDPVRRRRIADECRSHVLAEHGSPQRMVRRSEMVFRSVAALPARQTAQAPEPPMGGASNLAYWQEIQQEGYFEDHPCYEGIREFGEDEKIILKYTTLTPEKTVVEIGCGYGRDVLRIAPLSRHVYGIDVNDAILAKAVKFLGERNIDNFTPILAERWERDIPEGIDVVFSIVVFQHLTKDMVRNYVGGLARKLSPRGCFICQFAEDAHGSSDAMLKKYEPSVKWTADEIAALVADVGLELFALDSSQATESCVWHWAHFGVPDAA